MKKDIAVNFSDQHEKLGHPSEYLTIKTAKRMGVKLKNKKGNCVVCELAKSRK